MTYVMLEGVTNDIPPTHEPTDHRDELIEELRDRVRSLEEANRENRRLLLLALQERMPEIEQSPQNADSADEEEPPESTEGSRKSWWRRLFGG